MPVCRNKHANRRRHVQFPEELTRAAEFHTHLGPFLVVGLRMGRVVVREFGDEPFRTKIDVFTGKFPPYSCLSDGIQVSTPCTTGNGGMVVRDEREMRIEARHDGRILSVQLRPEIFDWIENECGEDDQHTFSLEIWEMPEERLFETRERTAAGRRTDLDAGSD
jgi:formylmethanofuran dehydrogenase subunit E